MKTVTVAAFRRIAALLFAVLLLLPLVVPFGAGTPAESEEASVPVLQSSSPDGELITESRVYQYVLGEILKCKSVIDVSDYNLDETEIGEVFATLFYSEAELFFIDGRYSFSRYQGSDVVRTISPVYPENVDEIPAMLAEFHEMTDAIVAKVDPTASDWEKIAFVHDYIALHYSYDYSLSIYDAYQLVTKETGVCQAYSLLTRYLLKKLGIECECVSCKGLNHEWNIVKIGNSWYHMDVTWDDWDDKGLYGQVSHAYFLSSDSYFDEGGHHSDDGWSSPVRATSGKYDGFFADVTTPFIFADNAIYAIKGNALVSYDPANEEFEDLLELNLAWSVSHGPFGIGGGTWNGIYAGLVYINGKLYWNGNKKIYSYDPVTREDPIVIYTYTPSSPRDKKLIFGFRAEADDRTTRFTLSLMSDPNSGEITETVYTAGGYVITWVIGGTSHETVCLKGETPHYDGSPELPSNLFDYTFLQWDKTVRSASADATYTAQFRMDRNETSLEGKTMRAQYSLIRAAILLLPYANAGYDEATARTAELNAIAADYAERVATVNATFSGVLFGDD